MTSGERVRAVPSVAEVARRYDEAAEGFDERFASDARTVARFARIDAPQLRMARGRDRVLEIGCGTGRLLAKARARFRAGVDVSLRLLLRARGRGLAVVLADAHALPFRDGTFDAVLSGNGVFRYLDAGRAFPACGRALRRGGLLAAHQYVAGASDVRTEGRHVRSVAELIRPAREAGFVPVRVHALRNLGRWPWALPLPRFLATRARHLTVVFRAG